MVWDKAGWLTCSRRPAADNPPASTTATKAASSRNSMTSSHHGLRRTGQSAGAKRGVGWPLAHSRVDDTADRAHPRGLPRRRHGQAVREQGSFLEIELAARRGELHRTCGGRAPNDDVVDTVFTLLVNAGNGPVIRDGIDRPTRLASHEFRYLAPPNPDPPKPAQA
jgi:hypothetical protein